MSEILKGIDLSILENNDATNEAESVDNILKTLDFDFIEANKNLEKKDKEEKSFLENAEEAKKELEENALALSQEESLYINEIKNDKQYDTALRYLDIFKENPQLVTAYNEAIKEHGSEEEARKAGNTALLLYPNKVFAEYRNNPKLKNDGLRYTIASVQGNKVYDQTIRADKFGELAKKEYQYSYKTKIMQGTGIAMEKSLRSATMTVASMVDLVPGFDTNMLSYIENNWSEAQASRDGLERLAEDLTQFGISLATGKTVLKYAGKLIGKVAPGTTKKILNKIRKEKTVLKKGKPVVVDGIKQVSSIAQKMGYWGVAGAVGYGVGEFITRDGNQDKTITDSVMLNTAMEDTKNLTGSAKAAATLRNKLRFGAEGTALIGGLTLGIKKAVVPLGKKILESSKIVLNPIGDVVQKAIAPLIAYETKKSRIGLPMIPRGIAYGWNALRSKSGIPKMEDWQILNESFTGLKGFRNRALRAIDRKFLAPTRARRYLPKELARIKKAQEGMLRDERKKVDLDLRNLEKNIYKLADVGMTTRIIGTSGNVGGQQYWQQVINYLRGGDINAVDKILRENVKNIRGQIDKLTMKLHPYIEDEKIAEELINGLQKYLTTSYQIFQGSFKPNKEIRKQAVQWFKDQIKRTDSRFANVKLTSPTLAKEAERRVADIITRGGQPFEGTTAQERLNAIVRDVIAPSGILKSKTKIPEIVQKLMGKVEDPRSIILNTITNQATLLGHIQANKKIVEQGLKYGYIFKDPADRTLKEIARLTGATLVKIKPNKGSSFLNLDDIYTYTQKTVKKNKAGKNITTTDKKSYYTLPEIAEGITSNALVTDVFLNTPIYKTFLAAKITSQLTKTVLSTMTQARNFETAAFFALLQGHIGRQASVLDAMKLTFGEILGTSGKVSPEVMKRKLSEYLKYNVTDSSAVAAEVESVMADIAGSRWSSTDKLFEYLMKNPIFKKATEFYQGSDNVWKAYGYEFTKSQLTAAIPKNLLNTVRGGNFGTIKGQIVDAPKYGITVKDAIKQGFRVEPGRTAPYTWQELITKQFDEVFKTKWDPKNLDGSLKTYGESIKEIAGEYIKNTYPNYGMVPAIVRNWRRLPAGNFVAFNSEVIRNVFNTTMFTSRELTSMNPYIRQMGARRLLGMSGVLYGSKKALDVITTELTELDQGFMTAYQRFYSPWFQKEHTLYPLSKMDEKDKSFTMGDWTVEQPYEAVTGGVEAIFNGLFNPLDSDEEMGKRFFKAFFYDFQEEKNGGFGILLGSFLPEPIFLEKMLDIWPKDWGVPGARGGVTQTGSMIYNPRYDNMGMVLAKSVSHVLQAVTPATINNMGKVMAGIDGKLDRAYSKVDTKFESMKMLLGLGPTEEKPLLKFPFVAKDLAGKVVDSRRKFYQTIGDPNDILLNPNNLINAFDELQNNRYLEMSRISDFVKFNRDGLKLKDSEQAVKLFNASKSIFSKKALNYIFADRFFPANLPDYKQDSSLFPAAFEKLKKSNPNLNFNDIYQPDSLVRIYKKWDGVPLGLSEPELDIWFATGKDPRINKVEIIEDKTEEVIEEPVQIETPKILEGINLSSIVKPNVPSDTAPVSAETIKTASVNNNVNPQTNLTRIEDALLSQTEKAIKLGQRKTTV